MRNKISVISVYSIRYYFLILLACLLSVITAKAQNVDLKCTLDKKEISIGDHVSLQFKLSFDPQQYRIQIPYLADTFNKFEVIERKKNDTATNGQIIEITKINLLTHYDSGVWVIPSQHFVITPLDGRPAYEIMSDSFSVQVTAPVVDTSKPIKPIFDVIAANQSWWDAYKKYIFSFLAILAVGLLLFYYNRRRRNSQPVAVDKVQYVSPWDNAIQKIDSLVSKELWLQQQEKEHYTQLTDIIRTYLEEGFNLDCFEKTSQEIITDVKKVLQQAKYKNRSEELNKLRALFYVADLVKFAKSKPTAEEHEQANEAAKTFVSNTCTILKKHQQEQKEEKNR